MTAPIGDKIPTTLEEFKKTIEETQKMIEFSKHVKPQATPSSGIYETIEFGVEDEMDHKLKVLSQILMRGLEPESEYVELTLTEKEPPVYARVAVESPTYVALPIIKRNAEYAPAPAMIDMERTRAILSKLSNSKVKSSQRWEELMKPATRQTIKDYIIYKMNRLVQKMHQGQNILEEESQVERALVLLEEIAKEKDSNFNSAVKGYRKFREKVEPGFESYRNALEKGFRLIQELDDFKKKEKTPLLKKALKSYSNELAHVKEQGRKQLVEKYFHDIVEKARQVI